MPQVVPEGWLKTFSIPKTRTGFLILIHIPDQCISCCKLQGRQPLDSFGPPLDFCHPLPVGVRGLAPRRPWISQGNPWILLTIYALGGTATALLLHCLYTEFCVFGCYISILSKGFQKAGCWGIPIGHGSRPGVLEIRPEIAH